MYETTEDLNNWSNFEEKEQSWKYYTLWYENMLHSHSNPKLYGTGTKTDIDKWDKIKPMHLWSIKLWQKRQEYTLGGMTDYSISRFGVNWTATFKRMKLEIFLTAWVKITQNALKTKM